MEIENEIVEELFRIAKLPVPSEITHEDLLNCIFKLKNPTEKNEELKEENIEFTPSDYAEFGGIFRHVLPLLYSSLIRLKAYIFHFRRLE